MMEYTNSQIRALIEEHVHNAKKRNILVMRLVDGLTYQEIADQTGTSPRNVGYILAKEIAKLAKYMD